MPWSDSPLSNVSEDLYEMSSYGKRIAHAINNGHNWDDSQVYGLVGAWGSGKSSLLNIIEKEITLPPTKWSVARFTPWATGDERGMLSEFYSCIYGVLPENERKDFRKDLGKLLEIAAPIAAEIPTLGQTMSWSASMAANYLGRTDSWSVQFRKVSDKLQKRGSSLLVIADDIDRLEPNELLVFFKVIRLLGRFPGISYIISYDIGMIIDSLASANSGVSDPGSAISYMEKIVQYQFDVPPLTTLQISDTFDSKLERLTQDHNITLNLNARYRNVSHIYMSQLSTPRSIERYFQHLSQALNFLNINEVDIDDLMVMTLLRVIAPTLYSKLPRYSYELTHGHTRELEFRDKNPGYKQFDYGVLLQEKDLSSRRDMAELLQHLFPKLANPESSNTHRRRMRLVSDPNYFDRYFSMGVLSSDISDVWVQDAFHEAIVGSFENLKNLLTEPNSKRLSKVLDKLDAILEMYDTDDLAEGESIHLFECLLAKLPSMSKDGGMLSSHFEVLERIAIKCLLHVKSEAGINRALEIMTKEVGLSQQVRLIQRGRWMEQYNENFHNIAANLLQNRVLEHINTHCLQKNEAPMDSGVISLVSFLNDQGKLKDLRSQLTEHVSTGHLSMKTIASRFVILSKIAGIEGANWRISDFEQNLFNEVAPLIEDGLYSGEILDIDVEDISWQNRESYVVGRVAAPVVDKFI